MQRRRFVALSTAALVAPRALFAQPKKLYRVAILDSASEAARPHDWADFRRRLHDLGLVEGKNVAYIARFAGGKHERLPALAAELVAVKPDIVVCAGTPETRAAIRATADIPIVFTASGDPVGTGLVASLARPGGNVTGFSAAASDTTQKDLELLRQFAPGAQRIAYMSDALNPGAAVVYTRLEDSARKLKLSIRMLDGSDRPALERSFAAVRREKVQGIIVGSSGTLLDHREQIVAFAARHRIPVIYGRREYVEAGGLVSYGADRRPLYRATGDLAHRILQGAKPAAIPVEQVAVIRTIINLKAAREQGINIPDSIRLTADEVIE